MRRLLSFVLSLNTERLSLRRASRAVARCESLHLVHEYGGSSSPTFVPRCSTVVSCGSQAMARSPLVNPHTETSSGTRNPLCFSRVHYADSRVVVHAEERTGRFAAQNVWRDALGVFAVVADEHQRLVGLQTSFSRAVSRCSGSVRAPSCPSCRRRRAVAARSRWVTAMNALRYRQLPHFALVYPCRYGRRNTSGMPRSMSDWKWACPCPSLACDTMTPHT